tara:strand:+ start:18546 stop:18962 length:417 start_codon:yes stop_codon:yes gene_type:complete
MTPEEIRAAISGDQAILALVPDTTAIASALSDGRTRIEKRNGGIGLIIETLGPDVGSQVLDSIDALRASNNAVKWAWYLLERGDLDFGSAATRGMIQLLFAESPPVRDALLAVAEVPDPVSEFEVRKAIFSDSGEVLV